MSEFINNEVIYDPHATITELGSFMRGLGHKFDPSTGLGMAIESIGYVSSTALHEMVLNNKNIYPELATDMKHLLRHVTDEEEIDLFATPSDASMVFYININDIIHNGKKTVIAGTTSITHEVTIAKNSTVTVNNTPFLILDDVKVTLLINDKGKSLSILYKGNEESYSYYGVGYIPASIIESNSIEWGVFTIPMKQLNVTLNKLTSVKDSPIDVVISLEDSYAYSEIYIENNGELTKLGKVFSKDIIDIEKPSILIDVFEDSVRYRVPKPFIYTEAISGDLYIYTYSTKGKMELPLRDFKSADFSFKLFNINKDETYTAMNNIAILASSNYIVDGGVDKRPFKDVRNKIINKTTGNILTPTTDAQLVERVKKKGFTIFKKVDTVTDRTYVAVRNTSVYHESKLPTELDIFLPTVKLAETTIDNKVQVSPAYIHVMEGALFKREKNAVIPYVMPGSMTKQQTISLLNDTEIFSTPFHYTISRDKSVIESKAYDLRNPSINKITVKDRNSKYLANANITSYRVVKKVDGYEIYFEVEGNEKYKAVENDTVIQLGLTTITGGKVYYKTEAVVIDGNDELFAEYAGKTLHKAKIITDFHIVHGLKLYNDLDTTNSLTTVPLECDIEAIILIPNTGLNNPGAETDLKLDYHLLVTNKSILTVQKVSLLLGKEVTGLWTVAYGLYNNNRYLRYTEDIYETYAENVYKKFDGCNYEIKDTNNDGKCDSITQTLLHSKGDPVKVNGKKVIKYAKGSIIEFNDKSLESKKGIDIFADLVLIDYRYEYINNKVYNEHIKYKIDQLVKWCLIDLAEVQKYLLERTRLLFKPNKNLYPITTTYGDIDGLVKPKVDIYYTDSVNIDIDYELIVNTVGKILNVYFGKRYIDINDLEGKVLKSLPNTPLSVRITHPGIDSNVISVKSDNRFRMSKKLTINNELVYDIDLTIKRI